METPPSSDLPHSGWGIASLIISLLSWPVILILTVMLANMQPKPAPHGEISAAAFDWLLETIFVTLFGDLIATAILATFIIPASTAFLALIFGIVGLFQPGRRKTYAVLGTALSAGGIAIVLAAVFM